MIHHARHLAVGRSGSDVRRRRLLTVAVATPLVIGVAIEKVAPLQGAEGWLIALAAMAALLAAADAGMRATEVGE